MLAPESLCRNYRNFFQSLLQALTGFLFRPLPLGMIQVYTRLERMSIVSIDKDAPFERAYESGIFVHHVHLFRAHILWYTLR